MATPQLITYSQTFTSDQFGNIRLTGGPVDIKNFSKVNFAIEYSPNQLPDPPTVIVTMGKISNWTLAQIIDKFVPDNFDPMIRTYDVVGPELDILIEGAPANVNVDIQAWVFLH